MEPINFDHFTQQYNILLKKQLSFFEQESYFSEYKIKLIKEFCTSAPKKILEYGCGIGRNLPFIQHYFPAAELTGCDISQESLAVAAQNNPAVNLFLLQEKTILPNDFDLILLAGVLHHIQPWQRPSIVKNISRSLAKDGELFIFEHNPYNPVTQRLVNTCEFDRDAQLLTKNQTKHLLLQNNLSLVQHRYTLFFPKFLHKLRFLERYLSWLPLGGQYFIQAKHNHQQQHTF